MGDHSLVLSVETGERVPLRVFIVGSGALASGLSAGEGAGALYAV